MTSVYFIVQEPIIVSIKLSPEVGNKEYFVLRNIAGGHSMSGFEVIEEEGGGGALDPSHRRSQEAKKRSVWIG